MMSATPVGIAQCMISHDIARSAIVRVVESTICRLSSDFGIPDRQVSFSNDDVMPEVILKREPCCAKTSSKARLSSRNDSVSVCVGCALKTSSRALGGISDLLRGILTRNSNMIVSGELEVRKAVNQATLLLLF